MLFVSKSKLTPFITKGYANKFKKTNIAAGLFERGEGDLVATLVASLPVGRQGWRPGQLAKVRTVCARRRVPTNYFVCNFY
jgi:hypothetical protein